MIQGEVFVYVQAVPLWIPSSIAKFSELSSADFQMTHSSKAALACALRVSNLTGCKIVALGLAPILGEAIARGASSSISVPLCENSRDQADSLPREGWHYFLVGENRDGFFSGASLVGAMKGEGAIHVTEGLRDEEKIAKLPHGSRIIVRDDGSSLPPVDVRRIRFSEQNKFEASITSSLDGIIRKKRRAESQSTTFGSPEELAVSISRKLRKYEGKS
jgi:hypothetical protein